MNRSTKRDLLLFAILLLMIRAAWHLPSSRPKATPLKSEQCTHDQPLVVHEIDPTVPAQIDNLQHRIDQAMTLADISDADKIELQDMQELLTSLRKQYCHTSPAIAFLGPIGYASIVLKEQRIEREILALVNKFTSILYHYISVTDSYESAHTVADGIKAVHTLLAQCPSSSAQKA